MKVIYWRLPGKQVMVNAGKKRADRMKFLDTFRAADRNSNDGVAHLYPERQAPRCWPLPTTTHYHKKNA